MTKLESIVLKILATSEYNELNGDIPSTPEESATYLWVDDIAEQAGLTMDQVKGVVSSLVKKGIIDVDAKNRMEDVYSGETDTIVCITEEGIRELWK